MGTIDKIIISACVWVFFVFILYGIGIIIFECGQSFGYKKGQIDALHGKYKYVLVEKTIEEVKEIK